MPLQQVNPFNRGTEENTDSKFISVPDLRALDKNDEANADRDPDYQFYVSYDFYGKDNDEFHRKGLYGFKQGIKEINIIIF